MAQWRTELMTGGQTLGVVNIRRGIFQGNRLSPLFLAVFLVPVFFYQMPKSSEGLRKVMDTNI